MLRSEIDLGRSVCPQIPACGPVYSYMVQTKKLIPGSLDIELSDMSMNDSFSCTCPLASWTSRPVSTVASHDKQASSWK